MRITETYPSDLPTGRPSNQRLIAGNPERPSGVRSNLALSACEWLSTRQIIWPITGAKKATSCCAWTANWRRNLRTAENLSLRRALATKSPIKRNPIDHRRGSAPSSSLLISAAPNNHAQNRRQPPYPHERDRAIPHHSMHPARAYPAASGRCGRPSRFRRQSDDVAARRLVQPAPLAQPRRRVRLSA